MHVNFVKSANNVTHVDSPITIFRSADDMWEWSDAQRWRLDLHLSVSDANAWAVEAALRDEWLALAREKKSGSFKEYINVRTNLAELKVKIATTEAAIAELGKAVRDHLQRLQFSDAKSARASIAEFEEDLEFMRGALPDLQAAIARTSKAAHADLDQLASQWLTGKRRELEARLRAAIDAVSKATFAEIFTTRYSLDLLASGSIDRWSRDAGLAVIVVPEPRPDFDNVAANPQSTSIPSAEDRKRERQDALRRTQALCERF
jgi:hypothetical protein